MKRQFTKEDMDGKFQTRIFLNYFLQEELPDTFMSPWWLKQLKKKKNRPAMEETQTQSLGQEDPLEKGMATYSKRSGGQEEKGATEDEMVG